MIDTAGTLLSSSTGSTSSSSAAPVAAVSGSVTVTVAPDVTAAASAATAAAAAAATQPTPPLVDHSVLHLGPSSTDPKTDPEPSVSLAAPTAAPAQSSRRRQRQNGVRFAAAPEVASSSERIGSQSVPVEELVRDVPKFKDMPKGFKERAEYFENYENVSKLALMRLNKTRPFCVTTRALPILSPNGKAVMYTGMTEQEFEKAANTLEGTARDEFLDMNRPGGEKGRRVVIKDALHLSAYGKRLFDVSPEGQLVPKAGGDYEHVAYDADNNKIVFTKVSITKDAQNAFKHALLNAIGLEDGYNGVASSYGQSFLDAVNPMNAPKNIKHVASHLMLFTDDVKALTVNLVKACKELDVPLPIKVVAAPLLALAYVAVAAVMLVVRLLCAGIRFGLGFAVWGALITAAVFFGIHILAIGGAFAAFKAIGLTVGVALAIGVPLLLNTIYTNVKLEKVSNELEALKKKTLPADSEARDILEASRTRDATEAASFARRSNGNQAQGGVAPAPDLVQSSDVTDGAFAAKSVSLHASHNRGRRRSGGGAGGGGGGGFAAAATSEATIAVPGSMLSSESLTAMRNPKASEPMTVSVLPEEPSAMVGTASSSSSSSSSAAAAPRMATSSSSSSSSSAAAAAAAGPTASPIDLRPLLKL